MNAQAADPIYRSESTADASKLDWETKLLRDVVDYGARLFAKFVEDRQIGHTEACLAVLALQSVAMADAVEVLLSAGTVDAARVPARSLFESQLYAQWIMRADTDQRALCWWAHVKSLERRDLESHVATTTRGLEVARLFADAGMPAPSVHEASRQSEARARLARLESRCKGAPWASIEVRKFWFMSAGAKDIRAVAADANQAHLYEFFYKPFCRDVHASNVERWLELSSGTGQVRSIRTLRGFSGLLQFVIPLMFSLYESFINRFLPAESASYGQMRLAWGPCLTRIREPRYQDPPSRSEAGS